MRSELSGEIRIVVNSIAQLAESPVWDISNNSLLWTDILSGHIHRFFISENRLYTLRFDEMVSCVVLRQNGKLLAAFKQGLAFVDEAGGREFVALPERHLTGNRFNDGKCDARGNFWIGSMALDERPGAGNVYTLDTGCNIKLQIRGTTVSNGIEWSSDNRFMYFIDSPTRQVFAYDFDAAENKVVNKRSIIKFEAKDGYPDGMTTDSEGMLWIAFWNGWRVARYNPATGELLREITLPVSRVTSCTFGGEHLSDLYVTSARTGLSKADLKRQPLAGSIFVIGNCGAHGNPANKFNG